MNIVVISKRPGQGGTSTLSYLLSASYAIYGSRVLYVPLALDLDDIDNWILNMDKKNPAYSINQIHSLYESGSLRPTILNDSTMQLMKNMNMIDFRASTADEKAFKDIVEYLMEQHSRKMVNPDPSRFDYVVYDYHDDERSKLIKPFILKNTDAIVEAVSNNKSIYSPNEDWLEEYRDKTISVDTKHNDNGKVNFIQALIEKITKKKSPRIVFDKELFKSHNSNTFKEYIREMFDDPSVKQDQIRSTVKYIMEEVETIV